jgi:hypothetical protein
MTLSMAWVRNVGQHEELIFCSDSRLRFGCAWDSCQKVFPLPRGDCAITFAGDTQFAYPFIHAAINSVSLHRGSKDRQLDITEVKPFLLKAINGMLEDISDFRHGQNSFDEPVLRLIFGGYSWKKKKFVIWTFHFNPGENAFKQGEVKSWRGLGSERKLIILGDPEASLSAKRQAKRLDSSEPKDSEDVERMAKERFIQLLEERGIKDGKGLDMEPFEVLIDFIRDEVSPYVGGAPQLVKVYQHLNSQPFGVSWEKDKGSGIAVLGRGLRNGEVMHLPTFDPDKLTYS